MSKAAVHLHIRGRVQGVGFRYAMSEQAVTLGVTGWVRNRRDGSVEAVVRGPAAAVEAMCRWVAHGPPGASVATVDTGAPAAEPELGRFEMRATA